MNNKPFGIIEIKEGICICGGSTPQLWWAGMVSMCDGQPLCCNSPGCFQWMGKYFKTKAEAQTFINAMEQKYTLHDGNGWRINFTGYLEYWIATGCENY